MNRCVILRVGAGSFETGFPVTCQLAPESQQPTIEQGGRLPAALGLIQIYQRWRSCYIQLGAPTRLEPQPDQVTNISWAADCLEAGQALQQALNQWLDSPEFRPICDKLLEQLRPEQSIRMLLLSDEVMLQKLPWHLWKFLERYPKAEIGFSAPLYEAPAVGILSPGVSILAVLGDSTGLDTQTDQQLLTGLPGAKVRVLVEPSRREFDACLWDAAWDILFFAGHSASDASGRGGLLWLNSTASITIADFKYALRQSLGRGLQLAIFNSCDGLGLAQALSDLNMPQMIVMREPVPDAVARAFLQHFLRAFAQDQPFHLAVREARERLEGLEFEFPCATWLPVIVQNPAAVPPTWKSLGGDPNRTDPQPQSEQSRPTDASMVTMVWTDLLDSTAMKRRLAGQYVSDRDQAYLAQILQPHRARVEGSLTSFRGRVIKTEGDACFLVFSSVTAALEWAIDLQRSHATQPITTPLGPLQVRIGIHTGNPICSDGDYIGHEVDYLVRIADLAQGDQILLSEVTAVLIRNAGFRDLEIYDHGHFLLKGIGSVPIFEALWDQRQPQPPRLDVKALFNQGFLRPVSPQPALLTWRVQPRQRFHKVLGVLLTSLIWSGAIGGIQWLGGFQPLELWSFDRLMRLRPPEKPDDRLLMITVTAQDLLQQSADSRRSALSDQNLLRLLQKIEPLKPRVIGLDIYRDFSVQAQFPQLAQLLRQNAKIIAVCKSRDAEGDPVGVAPPLEVPIDRVGFSDFIEDTDGVLRRQILFMTPDPLSPCQAHYGFATQVALRYLAHQGIEPSFTATGNLQIGKTLFQRLLPSDSGYLFQAEGGHQMVLNFRTLSNPQDIALQVSLSDVLNNKVAPDLIKDRAILIGVSANSSSDFWATPFGAGGVHKTSGVVIQAHMISHLLSAVLNQRPMIWTWPLWTTSLWTWAWGIGGGLIGLLTQRFQQGLIRLGMATLALWGVCLLCLTQGGWLPLVPAALALTLVGSTVGYQRKAKE